MKKQIGIALLLAMCLMLAMMLPAYATTIPFLDAQDDYILYFTDTVNGIDTRTASIQQNGFGTYAMWVGTVEHPTLGKAYLWSEDSGAYGLMLLSRNDFSSFTGNLELTPSPYCTFESTGTITVRADNGVASLQQNNLPIDTLSIKFNDNMTFSIAVKDQNGDPVPGAVFTLEAMVSGGNDSEKYGNLTSDANGILAFPMALKPDSIYWFSQKSAPAGYEPMPHQLVDVLLTENNGFAAFEYNTSNALPYLLNKKIATTQPQDPNANGGVGSAPIPQPAQPAASSQPPRSGDTAHPALYAAAMTAAAAGLWLLLRRRTVNHL